MILEGGMYDGMAAGAVDGKGPIGVDDTVFYIATRDSTEWRRILEEENPEHTSGTVFISTSVGNIPCASSKGFNKDFESLPHELYVRCTDGIWRTPALAGVRSVV